MFQWENRLTEEERVRKNALNLLQCRKGDIPLNRAAGINPDIIDKPYHEIGSEIYTEIMDMLEENEPRIYVEIEDTGSDETGTILEVVMENV